MRIGKKKARQPACKLVGGKLVLRNHNRKEKNLGVESCQSLHKMRQEEQGEGMMAIELCLKMIKAQMC